MVASTTFASSVITQLPVSVGTPSGVTEGTWRALGYKLLQSTVLQKPAAASSRTLLAQLATMSPGCQQIWSDVLLRRLCEIRGSTPCTICGQIVDFVFLDSEQSRSCMACKRDYTGPTDALYHGSILNADALSRKGLLRGDLCEPEMKARFGLLTRVANSLLVIDPFAYADCIRQESISPKSSGLYRMLKLCLDNGVSDVTIATTPRGSLHGHSLTGPQLLNTMRSFLVDLAGNGMTVENTFVTVPRAMHDRWLGFAWGPDSQASYTIGLGLAAFNGTSATRAHAIARVDDAEAITTGQSLSGFSAGRSAIVQP